MEIPNHATKTAYRTHCCHELTRDDDGSSVVLSGWVDDRRDLGNLIFITLRDRYGKTQLVFDPSESEEVVKAASDLKAEWVIQVEGIVRKRPEGQENKAMHTGAIEVLVQKLTLLNSSKILPFEVNEHSDEVNEELRLEYRYLDLRREKMHRNLLLRARVTAWSRQYLESLGFIDIETPMLVKGTPEGSREYLVPSRIHPGEFYVLPQAPQQMKQLLMLAGFDKYYQFAHCFRDEDLRGDRQPEFTQMDLEMSFVKQEDVMKVMEGWMLGLCKAIRPDMKIMAEPMPVMTFHDAMNTYGSDKPDIRFELTLQDASELFAGSGIRFMEDAVTNGGTIKALLVSGGSEYSRSQVSTFEGMVKQHGPKGLATLAWDAEGIMKGTIAKLVNEELAERLKHTLGANDGDILFFVADEWESTVLGLGALRSHLGQELGLIDNGLLAPLWIVDFPLFEKNGEGDVVAVHHPFTTPKVDNLSDLEDEKKKMEALSYTYDIVLNGYELGSGSIRIHDQKLQKKIFDYMNISEEEQERQFGHLLKAFQYGVPPHAGMAIGIERVSMILADMPNIREMIAFPKTLKARDLMFGAPTPMPEKNLSEANISVKHND